MALEIGAGITLGGGISLTVESGGGGSAWANGSLTVGSGNDRYGYFPAFSVGTLTVTPDNLVQALSYDSYSNVTAVRFAWGTFGPVTIDMMTNEIIGYSSVGITLGGVTQTLTYSSSDYQVAGDPFNLVTKNGQTVAFEITLA